MHLIIQAALIFLGLNAFYWLLYKYLSWHRTFIQPLAARVRFWVYLLIPLCTLNWIGARLYHDSLEATPSHPWITWLPRFSITALLVIILVEALLVLIFDYLYARRRGVVVPQIIQFLARGLVYLLAVALVMLSLFNIRIVVGVLIGVVILLFGIGQLMRDALGNLFAGLSLQISRLYGPGDWLRIGGHEGQVETTDWRSLALRTVTGSRVVLPLSLLARVPVINLTTRQARHTGEVEVIVDYAYSPEQVERVLLAALRDVGGLSAEPSPETQLLTFQTQGIRYAVRYGVMDFAQRDAVGTAVRRAIWYAFRRAGIRFAYPASEVFLHQDAPAADTTDERVSLLREIAFLRILTPEQVQPLASRLQRFLFARGETICRQGEPGQTFYVITRGRVKVSAVDDKGREMFTQTLLAGSFFGEFSLLTGAPRTATVTAEEETELLVMDKEDMRPALEANPQLAEHISGVLAQRQHELQESRARMPVAAGGPAPETETVDSLKRELLRKIVAFFSY